MNCQISPDLLVLPPDEVLDIPELLVHGFIIKSVRPVGKIMETTIFCHDKGYFVPDTEEFTVYGCREDAVTIAQQIFNRQKLPSHIYICYI